ncbi:MAG: Gfo/Idh/MocA family oxidoreductase [Saprospiraceae bacterium]|nr:Gfo/Idh/MocA family oxidoreductase [Saprospiraceae bacterium]
MAVIDLGIIMNGVTGRMGTNQHLIRSLKAIREDGGVALDDGDTIMPKLLLVGRNEDKLKKLCADHGAEQWTTNLQEALDSDQHTIYFDAQTTGRRVDAVKQAIAKGKHIYIEKPPATNLADAMDLYRIAEAKGVKHGVVQDKLWLPGLLRVKNLIDNGFFGRIMSVRGEFGYWVFEGFERTPNRPSWNYRKEEGGGIIIDMLCHWRYMLDNVFGHVQEVSCLGATHLPKRVDESGNAYECTADDAAYATFQLEGGTIVQLNSSWTVRVRRDDLLVLQVDGTRGSAMVGLRDCRIQSFEDTPVPVWNPDVPQPINFYDGWTEHLPDATYENAFKAQWKLFLKYMVKGGDFKWNLLEGAKGVQLAELGIESWKQRKWLSVPELG